MAILKKLYTDLLPVEFTLSDPDSILKKIQLRTIQGNNISVYNILGNVKDVLAKNYTVNYLTGKQQPKDFIDQEKTNENIANQDLSTSLTFAGLSPASAVNVLRYSLQNTNADVDVILASSINANETVVIDFLDDLTCKVKIFDFVEKEMVIPEPGGEIKFVQISQYPLYKRDGKNIFNYVYDVDSNIITFTNTISSIFNIVSPLSGRLYGVSPSIQAINNAFVKIEPQPGFIIENKFTDNFVYYDTTNNVYTVSDETLIEQEYNFLVYYPYEALTPTTTGFETQMTFFNLRNHISNNAYVNPLLQTDHTQNQRLYSSIVNAGAREIVNEPLAFSYNFYTKEYIFKADKITKFVLPDTLYPFSHVNINDTNLVNCGAYGGQSPYFSDKVFKLLDNNKTKNEPYPNIDFDLLFQDNTYMLTQDNDVFVLQEQGIPDTIVENNGTVLCSWLNTEDETQPGVWYDRYYNPTSITFIDAISSNEIPQFETLSQAEQYLIQNSLQDELFFDVKSNMVFEPQGTYFYERIGNKYINTMIDSISSLLLKDSFDVKTIDDGAVSVKQNSLVFASSGYDSFDLDTLTNRNYSISFKLNSDNTKPFQSYQIFGNYYNDGYAVLDDFYFTPFIVIPDSTNLHFYNSKLEFIRTIQVPQVDTIIDVLFLDQRNDFVVYGELGSIKTFIKLGFNGEVIDVVSDSSSVYNTFIQGGYKSRVIHSYNAVTFATPQSALYTLNLNSFSLSSTPDPLSAAYTDKILFSSLSGFIPISTDVSITSLTGVNAASTPYFITDDVYAYHDTKLIYFSKTDGGFYQQSLSATEKDIYSIGSYDNKLFIQSYSRTGSLSTGQLDVFSSERDYLSSFNLSVSAVSGKHIDFIKDETGINALSFSTNSLNQLIIDRINLETGQLSTIQTSYSALPEFFENPVGFYNIEQKYKDYQNKLYFRLNIDNFVSAELITVLWNTATFQFSASPAELTAGDLDGFGYWDAQFSVESAGDQNGLELLLPLGEVETSSMFTFNFNINDGTIDVYKDTYKLGTVSFSPNLFSMNRIITPDIFFNVPTIKNDPVTKFVNNSHFYGDNGSISDIALYDRTLSDDMILFKHLAQTRIDDINFDIPSGTRNNIEQISNLYNYNIPGFKNNDLKIYIKRSNVDAATREQLKAYLTEQIRANSNIQIGNIVFEFIDDTIQTDGVSTIESDIIAANPVDDPNVVFYQDGIVIHNGDVVTYNP
jgi:hypothetical protein